MTRTTAAIIMHLHPLQLLQYVLVAQSCPTLWDPWTIACQAPLVMAFSSKSTGVGCYFLLLVYTALNMTRASTLSEILLPHLFYRKQLLEASFGQGEDQTYSCGGF